MLKQGKKLVIRTPFPSAEKTAKKLGLTKKDIKEMGKIMNQLNMERLERATRRLKRAGMLKDTYAGDDMLAVLDFARAWITKNHLINKKTKNKPR
jgi:myo-inositol catabolism protein IolC